MSRTSYFLGADTRAKILQAALDTFSLLGYRKTSMADIADRANVSRPTLYTYFESKNDIMLAVSKGIHEYVFVQIKHALADDNKLDRQLSNAFKHWVKPYMEILFGSPYGIELIGQSSNIAENIVKLAHEKFKKMLASRLNQAEKLGDIQLTPSHKSKPEAAEFLILCVNGLSNGEATQRVFDARVELLIGGFLNTVQYKA